MSFELATIILFFLIAPGYSVMMGIKYGCRFSDVKSQNENTTEQTVFYLIVSSFILIVVIPSSVFLTDLIWQKYWNADFLKALFNKNPFLETEGESYSFKYLLWFSIALVYAVIIVISYNIGKHIIKKVEAGDWPTHIFHGAANYELVKGQYDPIIFCSVLTNIKHENCLLMYKGRLKDISYLSKNKIEYLSMSGTRRFLLRINPPSRYSTKPSTETFGDIPVTYFDDAKKDATELFFVDGQDIANVLFTKVPIVFKHSEHQCLVCNMLKWLKR